MRSDTLDLNDVIPLQLRSLVELFDGPLADVQFPGIDRQTLADACSRLGDKSAALAEARQACDDAQASLDEELDRLKKLGERAAAYVEIYAQGDAQLAETLNGLQLKKPASNAKAPRRRKRKTAGPELPLGAEGEPPERPSKSPRASARAVEAA